MKIKLVVLIGKNAGQVIPISDNRFFIGRAEDCHLRPRDERVSRHHCAILSEEGFVAIRDFGSRNGTFVNGERVHPERELRNGDRLKVGNLEFEVRIAGARKKPKVRSIQEAAARTLEEARAQEAAQGDADVNDWLDDDTSDWLDDDVQAVEPETHTHSAPQDAGRLKEHGSQNTEQAAPTDDAEQSRIEEMLASPEAQAAELARLRAAVEQTHVYYSFPEQSWLNFELLDPDSAACRTLAEPFYRLVVLDVAQGLDPDGRFDFTRFLRYVLAQMNERFQLDLDPEKFHPEVIVQVLKDEQRSLFCFLNAQHLSPDGFQHLREFTQLRHRVLYCGRNAHIAQFSIPVGVVVGTAIPEAPMDDEKIIELELPPPAPKEIATPSGIAGKSLSSGSREAAANMLRNFFRRP